MPSVTPLQILLFRGKSDQVEPFETAVVRAFQGGKHVGGYLATGQDLGVQLQVFLAAPSHAAREIVAASCHTACVVLVDDSFINEAPIWEWLLQYWKLCVAQPGRNRLFIVLSAESQREILASRYTGIADVQMLYTHQLGEYAIRPVLLSLRVLHECRLLMTDVVPAHPNHSGPPGFLRLFISHAKIDGLPLAQALKHLIRSMPWLSSFYDADDLPPGCEWKSELEKGVGSSLIVMLRTEEYDNRPWCRQEVIWADEYATPAVLVEARTSLDHASSNLPYERAPTVRIPDGNLVRILLLALREGLRYLLFVRRVEEMKRKNLLPKDADLRIFPYQPSMPALLRACQSFRLKGRGRVQRAIILYSDPPLRTGFFEAAHALVSAHSPRIRLVTPDTLAVGKGGRK